MFGNKKKESAPKKNSIIPTTASHSLNSLVHGTIVEGTVKSESDIRVDGVIKGSLNCSAKVIIGPTGFVEGEVRCVNAVIEGRFEGNLSVAELLNVRETAKVVGDVKTNKLIVQSGAVFSVSCKMGVKQGNGSMDARSSTAKSVVKAGSTPKKKVSVQKEAS